MGTELPDRKGNRLKGYDYSARGVYFVTICTQNRVCNLGSVVGADARIGPHAGLNPDVHIELSPLGRIAETGIIANGWFAALCNYAKPYSFFGGHPTQSGRDDASIVPYKYFPGCPHFQRARCSQGRAFRIPTSFLRPHHPH